MPQFCTQYIRNSNKSVIRHKFLSLFNTKIQNYDLIIIIQLLKRKVEMKKKIQFQKLNHFMISLQSKSKTYFNCDSKLSRTPSRFCYSIQATLAYQNGQPIILPSSIFKDIHTKLQQQLAQNKYKVTFLFVQNTLRVLYKTNIVIKKQILCTNNVNINNQQIFSLQKNIDERNQQNQYLQQLTLKQKTIFQIYLKQVYAHIKTACSFAGIPLYKKSIIQSNKILGNKTFHQEYLRQTLSFRSKLSGLSTKSCQISLPNTGLSTMKIHIRYQSVLTKQINQELQQILNILIPKQKNCLSSSNLYKITYINEQDCNLAIVGGVSTVQKIKVYKMIYHELQSDMSEEMLSQNKLLAKKILQTHSHNQKNQQNTIKRFKHQLNIIKQINLKNHYKFYMLNYYCSLNMTNNTIDDNVYYLDWQQISLSFFIQKYSSKLSMDDKLFIAIQIVLIVIDLHYCGIVHRDLKPSNYMVDIKIKDGILLPRLKLIDFSDSMIIKNNGAQVKVGQLKVYSTSAYCPLQSSTSHQNYLTEGLIKPQIDYWSVGIILYQIFFGTLPVSYSTSTAKDIHALWKYQFNQQMYRQDHEGVEIIKNIISFLSFQLVKFNPQERLPLKNVLAILLCTKKYYTQLKKNIIRDIK